MSISPFSLPLLSAVAEKEMMKVRSGSLTRSRRHLLDSDRPFPRATDQPYHSSQEIKELTIQDKPDFLTVSIVTKRVLPLRSPNEFHREIQILVCKILNQVDNDSRTVSPSPRLTMAQPSTKMPPFPWKQRKIKEEERLV